MAGKKLQVDDELESTWASQMPHKQWSLFSNYRSLQNDLPVSLVLNDPKLLRCFECDQSLTRDAFQSKHSERLFCVSCSSSTKGKRNKFAEKLLQSLTRPCKNARLGCKETPSCAEKHIHELLTCCYARCHCPFRGCSDIPFSSSLISHIEALHSNAFVRFTMGKSFSIPPGVLCEQSSVTLLQVLNGRDLFVLAIDVRTDCVAVTVCQLALDPSHYFRYETNACFGAWQMSTSDMVSCIDNWVENPFSNTFLLLPKKHIVANSSSSLELEISPYNKV